MTERKRAKIDVRHEIPQDVLFHIDAIAKRFRLDGMHYQLIKKHLHDRIIEEVLNLYDQSVYKAARHLGISYTSLYVTLKKKEKRMKEEFGCGKS